MRMLRWIYRKTRRDMIRNEAIWGKMGVTTIENKMREARLRWFRQMKRRYVHASIRRWERLTIMDVRIRRSMPKK